MSGFCIHDDLHTVGCPKHRLTVFRMDQSQNQADDGGLSFSRGTDQRHDLPGMCFHAGLCDYLFVLNIRKLDIPKLHRQAIFDLFIQFAATFKVLFSRDLFQFLQPMCRDRTAEESGDHTYHAIKRTGEIAPLLEKQRHSPKGDSMGPQTEQTVPEGDELNDHSQHRQEYIGLYGKHVVIQTEILPSFLPGSQLPAVLIGCSKGFDGIVIVEGFHLECHLITGNFPDLFPVLPLFFDKNP